MNIFEDAEKQRKAVYRAAKARSFLEADLWQECWDDFEQFIWEQIKQTESRDTEKLAHWKRLHVAGQAFKSFFERVVKEGTFAAADLEYKEKRGLLKVFSRK
jgi:hypothetical protein